MLDADSSENEDEDEEEFQRDGGAGSSVHSKEPESTLPAKRKVCQCALKDYVVEEGAGHFKEGFHLHGIHCGIAKKDTEAYEGETGEKRDIFLESTKGCGHPLVHNAKKPVNVCDCLKRTEDWGHALCGDCYRREITQDTSTAKRSRRTTRVA